MAKKNATAKTTESTGATATKDHTQIYFLVAVGACMFLFLAFVFFFPAIARLFDYSLAVAPTEWWGAVAVVATLLLGYLAFAFIQTRRFQELAEESRNLKLSQEKALESLEEAKKAVDEEAKRARALAQFGSELSFLAGSTHALLRRKTREKAVKGIIDALKEADFPSFDRDFYVSMSTVFWSQGYLDEAVEVRGIGQEKYGDDVGMRVYYLNAYYRTKEGVDPLKMDQAENALTGLFDQMQNSIRAPNDVRFVALVLGRIWLIKDSIEKLKCFV